MWFLYRQTTSSVSAQHRNLSLGGCRGFTEAAAAAVYRQRHSVTVDFWNHHFTFGTTQKHIIFKPLPFEPPLIP